MEGDTSAGHQFRNSCTQRAAGRSKHAATPGPRSQEGAPAALGPPPAQTVGACLLPSSPVQPCAPGLRLTLPSSYTHCSRGLSTMRSRCKPTPAARKPALRPPPTQSRLPPFHRAPMRLLIAMLLAGAVAAASPRRLAAEASEGGDGAAKTSAFWGAAGEKWEPDGPFIDFSYAGVGCKRPSWVMAQWMHVHAPLQRPAAEPANLPAALQFRYPNYLTQLPTAPPTLQATAAATPLYPARPSPSAWLTSERAAGATAPPCKPWLSGPTTSPPKQVRCRRWAGGQQGGQLLHVSCSLCRVCRCVGCNSRDLQCCSA